MISEYNTTSNTDEIGRSREKGSVRILSDL